MPQAQPVAQRGSRAVHPTEGSPMAGEVNRRDFLSTLGVSVGAAFAAAGTVPVVGVAHAQDKPKGNIPDKPFRIGHMTFFTGPAAVLGEPMRSEERRVGKEWRCRWSCRRGK